MYGCRGPRCGPPLSSASLFDHRLPGVGFAASRSTLPSFIFYVDDGLYPPLVLALSYLLFYLRGRDSTLPPLDIGLQPFLHKQLTRAVDHHAGFVISTGSHRPVSGSYEAYILVSIKITLVWMHLIRAVLQCCFPAHPQEVERPLFAYASFTLVPRASRTLTPWLTSVNSWRIISPVCWHWSRSANI